MKPNASSHKMLHDLSPIRLEGPDPNHVIYDPGNHIRHHSHLIKKDKKAITMMSQIESQHHETKHNKCNPCRWVVIFLFLAAFAVGCAAALSFFYLGTPNPAAFFTPQDPPFEGNITEWESSKSGGLHLNVVNALDDKWAEIFDEYVGRWDYADALQLTTSQMDPDFECKPIQGELKVCNGDYGDTDWRGISLNLIRGDYIVQGVAKMNDHFLDGASSTERRYTMCHELGHGFGLPHTDEDYFNRNRGDCLDYTNVQHTNLHPGTFNYDRLTELYGTIPPNRQLAEEDVPDDIVEKYNSVATQMEDPDHPCEDGVCLEDLGGGYQVVAHKLLV